MNIRFLYLFILLFSFSSLLGNRNKAPYRAAKIAKDYCDLKKNIVVAIVESNYKASPPITGKAANRKKYSFMNHYNSWGDAFRVGEDFRQSKKKSKSINNYEKSEHKMVFSSIGDAKFAIEECSLSEVREGTVVSEDDLKCINTYLNNKIKTYVRISSPSNSGWQRNSIQRLKEVEAKNIAAKSNGDKLIVYKTLQYPKTRFLIEDLLYTAVESALARSSQFTAADRNNLSSAFDEIKDASALNDQNQKEIGKMVGADLIAIANITDYMEDRVKESSKVTMAAEVKFLDVESGTIFNSFNIEKDHTIHEKKSYTNARREMFQKWSLELTQQIDENIKDFPFERNVMVSPSGGITMRAGKKDGVLNDMFFNLTMMECFEDDYSEEMICDEVDIGLIQVDDNNRGRGVKAGESSKCIPINFDQKLERYNSDDEPIIYTARTPKDIADKMKCP
tara:strand:- start:623 stop:1972 length:1350 start_codon:yes stop_codon:yes gene_type:complete